MMTQRADLRRDVHGYVNAFGRRRARIWMAEGIWLANAPEFSGDPHVEQLLGDHAGKTWTVVSGSRRTGR
jgi:hypothetical protein